MCISDATSEGHQNNGTQDIRISLTLYMNVPSLADCKLQLKLSLLYKIVHMVCVTSPQIFFVPILIIVMITELITPLQLINLTFA